MFKIVYSTMPTDAELDEIEQVALVDEVPPATPLGTGSLSVLYIGETEKGVFTPQRVSGVTDYATKYGGLGWTTSAGKSQGAVARRSCGSRPWEGNLYTARNRKRFGGLVICRVDGSAGSVQFRRLAAIKGGKGPFSVASGTTVTLQRNGSVNVTATFTGVAAQIVGVSGTYPTLFVGGETIEVEIDDQGPRVITMTATEQALADVIARINAVLALTVASNSGGELALSSVIEGTSGYLKIIGGTALSTLGHVATPVQDVWTYTMVNAQVGDYVLRVTRYLDGVLTTYDVEYTSADAVEANLGNGLFAAAQALAIPGATWTQPAPTTLRITGDANVLFTATVQTEVSAGDITVAHTTTGRITEAQGQGNVPNVAFIEAADAAAVFGALANIDSYVDSEGYIWAAETATPATGKLQATAGAYADFGFDNVLSDAADSDEVTLPAGVRLRDTQNQLWVTMESYDTTTEGGPFSVRVRPWDDIDTALPASANTITTVVDEMPGYWNVTNAAEVKRLSAAQMDIRYEEAMDRTLDLNSDAAECRIIVSARHTDYINKALKANAIAATKAGLDARIAIVAPPTGIAKETALSESAALSVGKMRSDRAIYCFPGVRVTIAELRAVGAAGGIGFSDEGIIEQPADSWMAFVRSKIRPEQSAGQNLRKTNVGELQIDSLEEAYEAQLGGQGLVMEDYIQFKAKGIAALRLIKPLGYTFQSDVTSVLRANDKAIAPSYRRFMTDQIIDDGYDIGVVFKDDVNSPNTRGAIRDMLMKYLGTLFKADRIGPFSVYLDSSPEQLDAGLLIYRIKVKLLGIIQAIAFRLQVGAEGVEVEEIAA